MIIMIDVIKKLFSKKDNKKIVKVYKLPDSKEGRELVDKVVSNKMADVLAENYKLKQEIDKLRRLLENKKNEQMKKFTDEAMKFYQKKKKEEMNRTLVFKLCTKKDIDGVSLKELPKFFLKSNKVYGKYKYFWGFELYETEDGYPIWYVLLTDGNKVVKFKKPSSEIFDFFKETVGIASQLNGGKFDSNLDIDVDGRPLLLKNNEGKLQGSDTKVKIINLSDQERLEYEKKISELKDMVNRLYAELEDLKTRESLYKKELMDKDLALNVSNKEKEISESRLVAMADKQIRMFKQLADSLLSIQDIKLSQLLDEDLAKRLLRTVEVTRDKLDELQQSGGIQDFIEDNRNMIYNIESKLDALKDKLERVAEMKIGGKSE